MGKRLTKYPYVKDMYEMASSILGYDLYKLCTKGPKQSLDRTINQQPALLVTSLAAVERCFCHFCNTYHFALINFLWHLSNTLKFIFKLLEML